VVIIASFLLLPLVTGTFRIPCLFSAQVSHNSPQRVLRSLWADVPSGPPFCDRGPKARSSALRYPPSSPCAISPFPSVLRERWPWKNSSFLGPFLPRNRFCLDSEPRRRWRIPFSPGRSLPLSRLRHSKPELIFFIEGVFSFSTRRLFLDPSRMAFHAFPNSTYLCIRYGHTGLKGPPSATDRLDLSFCCLSAHLPPPLTGTSRTFSVRRYLHTLHPSFS